MLFGTDRMVAIDPGAGICCDAQRHFKRLRCVLCSIPGVIVVKGHDRIIESRTGLRAMIFGAGMLACAAARGRGQARVPPG